MSVVFDHRTAGTAESAWVAAAPWRGSPALELDASRLIVLAAHPDDESLGAAGLISACHERGIAVRVVVVTDGEASHPGSAQGGVRGTVRRAESVEALRRLAPEAEVTFLGVADGGIREDRQAVAHTIAEIVEDGDGTTLLAAPWSGDGHRDHRVLGEIARSMSTDRIRVIEYPIWLWHWGSPAEVDASQWCVLPLDAEALRRKRHSIAAHASQLHALSDSPGDEPIVHPGMLAHFTRPFEIFIDAARPPAREHSVDDAYFAGLYARHDDPWGFDSRWYEERKRDLVLAALPRRHYASALEVGAATGALTRALAPRAGEILGIDSSAHALGRAAHRCRDEPNVAFAQHRVPQSWPSGPFDLIVLSEIAYYLSAADRASMIDRVRRSLTAHGTVVACHWRHPIDGAPTDGDTVHAELAAGLGLVRRVRHDEEDFLLEVFTTAGAPSVAAQENLR